MFDSETEDEYGWIKKRMEGLKTAADFIPVLYLQKQCLRDRKKLTIVSWKNMIHKKMREGGKKNWRAEEGNEKKAGDFNRGNKGKK